MEERTVNRPFGVRDEIGYGIGDTAGSFVNLYIEGYFLTFCTYVLGIAPQWMAGLFFGARLLDACLGPLFGSFPDRWELGKSGNKFLPWVRLFSLPLAVSGVLCFLEMPFSERALHMWIAGCYLLYSLCYSGTSIPYGAMVNVISPHSSDRSRLSRARSIGGTVVSVGALSLVPILCFDKDANLIPYRFTLLAVVFGVCCLIGYEIFGRLTKERIRQERKEKERFQFKKVLGAAVKNRPLLGLMAATIGGMMALSSVQLSSYIYKEYYQNTEAMTVGSLLNLPVLLLCFFMVPRLAARFGKRGLVLWAVAFSFFINFCKLRWVLGNVWIYMILCCIGNVGQTVFNMLVWSMAADCLDYSEWKLHFRSDGSMYGLYVFSRKLGNTIASTGIAIALPAVGYVAGSNMVQSAFTIDGIYYLVNGVPFLACGIELAGLGIIYNLDKKTCCQMYEDLKRA